MSTEEIIKQLKDLAVIYSGINYTGFCIDTEFNGMCDIGISASLRLTASRLENLYLEVQKNEQSGIEESCERAEES